MKWGVDDVTVPIRWESVQEGFLGGEGGWCFMGLTLFGGQGGGGAFNKQRLRSGFIGGGLSGLILCCFYSNQRGQNKELDCSGMHSGWWVCKAAGQCATAITEM